MGNYHKERNYVTKLRRKSVSKYMRIKSEVGGRGFWETVKPLFTNKSKADVSKVVLYENENVVYKPSEVADLFNGHFVNIARSIGKPDVIPIGQGAVETVTKHRDYLSITWITKNVERKAVFKFSKVKCQEIWLTGLNGEKSHRCR